MLLLYKSCISSLPQRLPCKCRQHKAGLVNPLVVVPTQLFLLLRIPATHRCCDISILVFAAHHEANLARWIGGNGGVRVFDDREDFLASLFEICDESKVEPLIFRCNAS